MIKAKQPSLQEFLEMAARCSGEIKMLRAQNAILASKAQAYDNMEILLQLIPKKSQAYGEDLAWQLDKRIADLTPPNDTQ